MECGLRRLSGHQAAESEPVLCNLGTVIGLRDVKEIRETGAQGTSVMVFPEKTRNGDLPGMWQCHRKD